MKNTISKVTSLLLAGAMTTSVAPTIASASGVDDVSAVTDNYYVNNEKEVKLYHMNGMYTVLVGTRPVYVYLDNVFVNEYLPKNDALEMMKNKYSETYVMSKKVKNINYVKGVSNPSEEYRTVYALSYTPNVSGWTKVNKNTLGSDVMVATTIELGNFLAKDVDLSVYQTNMIGFGNYDVNRDGMADEVVYFGNNKLNVMFSKTDAVNYAKDNNLYYQVRYLPSTDMPGQTVTLYSLSEKSYVPGWTRISKNDLPKDSFVSSSIEFAEAHYVMNFNKKSLTSETIKVQVSPTFNYNFMKKDDALNYAYANYASAGFCILTKTVYDPASNDVYILYAFSNTPYIDGWRIIGNDEIDVNSCIFLTMEDAYNFEAELNSGYSRALTIN